MAVYRQPKSKYWWYKFTWNGKLIRESTKQTNKRVAEQMEAAHRTALAKGEVGIRDMTRSRCRRSQGSLTVNFAFRAGHFEGKTKRNKVLREQR
jgi:hypothetical protein